MKQDDKPKRIIISKNFSVLIICLFISLFIWVIINFSKEHPSDFICKIRVSDPPGGMMLSKRSDSLVNVYLRATGYELFSLEYGDSDPHINIDLSGLVVRQEKNFFRGILHSNNLRNIIAGQLGLDNKILKLDPDTLQFYFEQVFSRKIPIVPNLDVTYKPRYGLYGNISLKPDSIEIRVPRSFKDSLRFIQTRPVVLEGIADDQSVKAALIIPDFVQGINLKTEYVNIQIPVEEYTEEVVEVPIRVVFQGESQKMKLFPEKVKVKFRIALKDYGIIRVEDFKPIVNLNMPYKDAPKRLKIEIKEFPDYAGMPSLAPERVEYLLLK